MDREGLKQLRVCDFACAHNDKVRVTYENWRSTEGSQLFSWPAHRGLGAGLKWVDADVRRRICSIKTTPIPRPVTSTAASWRRFQIDCRRGLLLPSWKIHRISCAFDAKHLLL